jgi:hypothetical protein
MAAAAIAAPILWDVNDMVLLSDIGDLVDADVPTLVNVSSVG